MFLIDKMRADNKLLGTALLGLDVVSALEAVWEGPLRPQLLGAIEMGLRAFLTSPHLAVLQLPEGLYGDKIGDIRWLDPGAREYFDPFSDHLLDYEFINPEIILERQSLNTDESSFLTELVLQRAAEEILDRMPADIQNKFEADRYIDAWYKGASHGTCYHYAKEYQSMEFQEKLAYEKQWGDTYSGFHSSGEIISGFCPHICICIAIHLFIRMQNAVLERVDHKISFRT